MIALHQMPGYYLQGFVPVSILVLLLIVFVDVGSLLVGKADITYYLLSRHFDSLGIPICLKNVAELIHALATGRLGDSSLAFYAAMSEANGYHTATDAS